MFFFNDTATTEIYTLSLHDALPIWKGRDGLLRFSETVEKSGNRTVRLLFARFAVSSETAQPILEEIQRLGRAYENLQPRSDEPTSESPSPQYPVCRFLLAKKNHTCS